MVALTLGVAATCDAVVGELQIVVSGALGVPFGATADAEITLAIGAGLPVSLVSGGASTWPTTVGVATFAEWSDTRLSAGFAQTADLMVFRLGGGFTVVAAGVRPATSGVGVPPFLTTFSATSPAETLSGTWSVAGATALGIANAGAADAVVTFTFDTNPANTISGTVDFIAQHALSSLVNKTVPSVATVGVTRDVPVLGVAGGSIGPRMGTLTSYSAFDLAGPVGDTVELSAIDFGVGVYVLYGCAFPGPGTGLACLVGGTGSAAHLSGHIERTAGQFVQSIAGVSSSDLLLHLTGSLP